MNLDRVKAGDRLSAARENRLLAQVNALSRPGTPGQAQYGTAGVAFFGPPETRLALFELTGPVTYPDLSTAPTGYYDREPTAWAAAQRVWCYQAQASDQTYAGAAVRSYAVPDDAPEETIWFPLTRRSDAAIDGYGTMLPGAVPDGYGVGPPGVSTGMRVLALFDRQSGRWEVVEGPPRHVACWGMLLGQLNSGGWAWVALWWDGGYPGAAVRAYDWLLASGTSLANGTRVKVEFFPQDNQWWVTGAQCS